MYTLYITYISDLGIETEGLLHKGVRSAISQRFHSGGDALSRHRCRGDIGPFGHSLNGYIVDWITSERMTPCSMCSGSATGVFRYRTLNAIRSVEEPLCECCALTVADLASVNEFGSVE